MTHFTSLSFRALAAATLLATGALCAESRASDCDKWDVSIGQPGFNGAVRALTMFNGQLIAGGLFDMTSDEETILNHIARWDEPTQSWKPLGSGLNGTVYALTVYNGQLIAGGAFTHAGGTLVNRIARWNGSSWQGVGGGVSHTPPITPQVLALTVHDGHLIAGGQFTHAGGALVNHIARWNGSTWQAMSGGMSASVQELTVYNGDVVAAGYFKSAGSPAITVNHIARWNSATGWSAFGGGFNEFARALHVFEGDLYAGGFFTIADGQPANRIARWDGTKWNAMGAGFNSIVNVITDYNGSLFVGGNFSQTGDGWVVNRIARWDESSVEGNPWKPLVWGVTNWVFALAEYEDDLIVAGYVTAASGWPTKSIATWVGCAADPTPDCPADLTGSGSVGVADLLQLLSCWGPVTGGGACAAADLTGSGGVGVADLLALLAAWGPCPQ